MRPGKHVWIAVASSAIGLLTACGGASRPSGSHEPRTLELMPRADGPVDRTAQLLLESSFAQGQLRHARVCAARSAAQPRIRELYDEKKLAYPAAEIYLRVFKRERVLEVWARPIAQKRFQLLTSYPVCALAGVPGPKRRQGDAQVPEGFYHIDRFNPASTYHLSLRISYPNPRDRAANVARHDLGGDIYIHGGCVSDGCLAITDAAIQELYWMAVEARAIGQQRIPVHIFPARLDSAQIRRIDFNYADDPALIAFWQTLKPGYDYFEQKRRVPQFDTDARGTYVFEN